MVNPKTLIVDSLQLVMLLACGTPSEPSDVARTESKQHIVYEEAQFGFAGRTGTRWEVQPDGTVNRFWILPGNVLEEYDYGTTKKLSFSDMERLNEALVAADFDAMTIESGDEILVNPAEISISAFGRTLSIQLEPGQTIKDEWTVAEGTNRYRFLEAAATIKTALEK